MPIINLKPATVLQRVAARRPTPPSYKNQVLEAFDSLKHADNRAREEERARVEREARNKL